MTTESRVLGFEDYPEPVEAMLDAHEWEEPLNRQRMGVVLTFATTVPYHGGSHRFYVDRLSTGHEVYLQHPGQLNNGFDYQVRVEGWDDSATMRPSHDEIYSDFAHKREHAPQEAFEALCRTAFDIHAGKAPDEAIREYADRFDFTEGRVPEALLRPLPWLLIEQDIRYWHGDGRDRTMGTIESLYDGDPIDEIDDLQPLPEINRSELSIRSRT
ncbi:hypothetical protein [Halostella litorea]|uniref:hypothetical protein n=1 Tax=Halostella litorea TaxID=2528831 RepID=UPI0010920325|nr:hypothetical protein [Halostella litorea]